MIKIDELKKFATDPFLEEFKPVMDKMKILIKDGSITHLELYNTINEVIGCLNVYQHNIREYAQYSEDEEDHL